MIPFTFTTPRAELQLENLWISNRDYSPYFEHASLFQPSDAFELEYDYGDESPEVVIAYRTSLRTAIARLNLLGYSLEALRDRYEQLHFGFRQLRLGDFEFPSDPPFDVLADAVRLIDLSTVQPDLPAKGKGSPLSATAPALLSWLGKVPASEMERDILEHWSESVAADLDPYTLFYIFAQVPGNLELPVIWHMRSELDDSGIPEEDVEVGAKRQNRFLIVTEGSSDTAVIQKALELLRPKVADFFEFIDMERNYPFTGIGNLHNFYQGLVKIGMLNSALFIYDNDAAGFSKFVDAEELGAPYNIRVMRLPDMAPFEKFATVGPTGEQIADINGKAVAIELFLDLSWKCHRSPRVRWTSYNVRSGEFQGELENKESHVKSFLALGPSDLATYDTAKLAVLLDTILAECSQIAATRVQEEGLLFK